MSLDTVDWFDGSIVISIDRSKCNMWQSVLFKRSQFETFPWVVTAHTQAHKENIPVLEGSCSILAEYLHWTSKLDSQGPVKEAALQHASYGWSRASRAWQRARSSWAQPCKWFGGHSHPFVCFIFSSQPEMAAPGWQVRLHQGFSLG